MPSEPMEKSYQLLPLVGINQAPNQLAYIYVVRMIVIDTGPGMIGSQAAVDRTVCWAIYGSVVDTASIGKTLVTPVGRLDRKSVA